MIHHHRHHIYIYIYVGGVEVVNLADSILEQARLAVLEREEARQTELTKARLKVLRDYVTYFDQFYELGAIKVCVCRMYI